jgi:hypothetical protein
LEIIPKEVEHHDNKEHAICSAVELTDQAACSEKSTKHADDETPSEMVSFPIEVLSAHEYENTMTS